MQADLKKYLSEIGRKGGLKSRRTLSSSTAQNMVKIREARKAYRLFFSQCFWSYDPNYKIQTSDIAWVAKTLMKHGNHEAWRIGARLCR